ncbi:MAG TPA: hypothetical protein VEB69_14975 [Acidimicrobiia bacterium]|nr:hypothetical protein [Acidimicrobiia bacterium]
MWMRAALSVLWLALLLSALAVLDCTSRLLGDPLRVCDDISGLGIPAPSTVAPVVAALSTLGLIAVWLPLLRPRSRRRKYQPERALVENIGRLRDPYGDLVGVDVDGESVIAELRRGVEVVETAFATDSTATRSMTSEWMRLLLEANRLHNEGSLPTEEFKTLNTRLLQVVNTVSPLSRS